MLRTRVTVLAGYLGAGKTTLLNALLRDTPEPLGVIVNDFGSVNVDASLVAGQTSVEGEVALQNGCICCTIRGDLLTALLSLVRRPKAPQHILIETSGVSDPASVARTFIDARISDYVELAAVVGCVDASTFSTLVDHDWKLASSQLGACDYVVLTKVDEASEAQREATRELVRTLAPRARMLTSCPEDTPTALLLDAQVVWDEARAAEPKNEHVHVHEVGHHHGHHHHGHAFETWTFRSARPLSVYALRRALAQLPKPVVRAKGFVHTAEAPTTRLLVQVVGGRAELRDAGDWDADTPTTELVFLGAEGTLPVDELQATLAGCEHDGQPVHQGFMDDMLGYFNRLLSGVPGHGL